MISYFTLLIIIVVCAKNTVARSKSNIHSKYSFGKFSLFNYLICTLPLNTYNLYKNWTFLYFLNLKCQKKKIICIRLGIV